MWEGFGLADGEAGTGLLERAIEDRLAEVLRLRPAGATTAFLASIGLPEGAQPTDPDAAHEAFSKAFSDAGAYVAASKPPVDASPKAGSLAEHLILRHLRAGWHESSIQQDDEGDPTAAAAAAVFGTVARASEAGEVARAATFAWLHALYRLDPGVIEAYRRVFPETMGRAFPRGDLDLHTTQAVEFICSLRRGLFIAASSIPDPTTRLDSFSHAVSAFRDSDIVSGVSILREMEANGEAEWQVLMGAMCSADEVAPASQALDALLDIVAGRPMLHPGLVAVLTAATEVFWRMRMPGRYRPGSGSRTRPRPARPDAAEAGERWLGQAVGAARHQVTRLPALLQAAMLVSHPGDGGQGRQKHSQHETTGESHRRWLQ